MTSHSYEVALFGEFFSQDLKAILNRITLHSESSQPFQSREIVFEPIDAQLQRDANTEPILLRAKKEISEPNASWYLHYVYHRVYFVACALIMRLLFQRQGAILLPQARISPCSS